MAGILYELVFSVAEEEDDENKASVDLAHDYIVEPLPGGEINSNYTKQGTMQYAGSKSSVYANTNI